MLKATITVLRAVASTITGQFILVRRLLDVPLLTDAEFRAFFKTLNHEMSVSELAFLRPGKVETDTASFTDGETFQFGKVPSDTTLFVDAPALSFTKVLGDTVSITDLLERTWVRFDTAGFADSDTKAFGKVLNEVYALDYFAEDYANEDEAKVLDSFNMIVSYLRSFTESPGATDAGIIGVQNYVESGYFAEDYVGASWTF